MGVPKGTDNFKGYRDSTVGAKVELLREELRKAKKRKVQYPDKPSLVADMVERTKLHRTTLTRNAKYHKLILEHLATQPGASTFVSEEDAPPELLRAKLLDAKMEIGRLERELEKSRAAAAGGVNLTESAAHAAFSDTVWVLREVIERINEAGETLVVDVKQGEIRDLAASKGRQVVIGGQRTRAFIEQYKRLLKQEGVV